MADLNKALDELFKLFMKDDNQQKAFAADPHGYLTQRGLGSATASDVTNAVHQISTAPGVLSPQQSGVITAALNTGSNYNINQGGYHGPSAPPPVPGIEGAAQQLAYYTNVINNTTNVDQHDTNVSNHLMNVAFPGGTATMDLNQPIASGDHAAAAGGDMQGVATGDHAVGVGPGASDVTAVTGDGAVGFGRGADAMGITTGSGTTNVQGIQDAHHLVGTSVGSEGGTVSGAVAEGPGAAASGAGSAAGGGDHGAAGGVAAGEHGTAVEGSGHVATEGGISVDAQHSQSNVAVAPTTNVGGSGGEQHGASIDQSNQSGQSGGDQAFATGADRMGHDGMIGDVVHDPMPVQPDNPTTIIDDFSRGQAPTPGDVNVHSPLTEMPGNDPVGDPSQVPDHGQAGREYTDD